ncbi:MAG: tetratricopeptide repeat protein [Phycisphaerae bacterium]|jgi:serine/threonine-protein kinase
MSSQRANSATETLQPAVDVGACQNCGERGSLTRRSERLRLCSVCRFVAPAELPSQTAVEDSDLLGFVTALRDTYTPMRVLGRGAHGVTLLVEHQLLRYACVVKLVPHATSDSSPASTMRLRNEARAGLRVNSPNVVRVLDCDHVGGAWYFVMEYIEGVDLGAVTDCGHLLDWRQALRFAVDAATGLYAVHHAGLLHRDVKPENLILGLDGRVRLADLGIASFLDDGSAAGSPSESSGTLTHVAPEALVPGARIDARADLYSLGVSLYQLLTGRTPHAAASVYQSLLDAQWRPAEWPAAAREVPGWFVEVILRLLAPAPQDRYASAEVLLEHLRHSDGRHEPLAPEGAVERSAPRGLTVLPFENETGHAPDEWLCYAIADNVSRGLSRVPGVYVSDRDEFMKVLERVRRGAPQFDESALREAGRLTGAATVIRGKFQRQDAGITIWCDVHNPGAGVHRQLEPVGGSLARLGELRSLLFRQVCQAVGVDAHFDAVAAGDNPPPAAQEAFFLARRAHLRGEYEQAMKHAADAVAIDPEFCEAIGMLGACCSRLGLYEQAARHHQQQELVAGRRGDGRQVVEAQANLGVMHYFRGEYEQALGHYQRAAHTAEALGLASELAQICNNLGFVQFRLGRTVEAQAAFSRAIEMHKSFGALVFLIGPYSGIGNILRQEQRLDEARDYYHRALALALESDDRVNVGISYMHLGRCALQLGRIAVAKHELALSLSALEETRFWNGLTRVYESIAELNLRLHNYAEAVRCADRQIELARLHANRGMEAAAWRLRAQALSAAGQPDAAASSLDRAAELEAIRPVGANQAS